VEKLKETREVLFPDWEGPDKTGMTIEQTSGGQLFVKEVKGESPAARSGKVYEGDQIVGATIYFENMSSEETAELLKTLNKHKVGLKLQNKGDKSPYYSPLSTPWSREQGDESVQDSEISVTLRDNKNTAGSHVTGGSGGAGIISTDENGGSVSLSLPGKGM
uniref:AHNAK nucleoprotein n=2 Tax=Oreochromis TaxID=8139 RepID=A0A669F7G2_ORENI